MKFVLFLIKKKRETIIDHKTRFWNKAVPLAIQDIYLSKYGANSYKNTCILSNHQTQTKCPKYSIFYWVIFDNGVCLIPYKKDYYRLEH